MTPVMVIEVFLLCYAGQRSVHHILRVFMLRIFPYIVCDIPHYIRGDTRLCYDMPIMVIEDAYNYYLT